LSQRKFREVIHGRSIGIEYFPLTLYLDKDNDILKTCRCIWYYRDSKISVSNRILSRAHYWPFHTHKKKDEREQEREREKIDHSFYNCIMLSVIWTGNNRCSELDTYYMTRLSDHGFHFTIFVLCKSKPETYL
jgi:hypothetical protein